MSDEATVPATPPAPIDQKKIVRPSGDRAYWLPGVEGICLESALCDFVGHRGVARLVVSKRLIGGKAHYVFELKKDHMKT